MNLRFADLVLGLSLLAVGCGTSTKVRMSGPPDAQVAGHYRGDHVRSEFSGRASWVMDFKRHELQEFEFRKLRQEDTVTLEIREGRNRVVQVTAGPASVGARALNEGGWSVHILRPGGP